MTPGHAPSARLSALIPLGVLLLTVLMSACLGGTDAGKETGAPNFTLLTYGSEGIENGESVSLSELGGHAVVINFWAEWCAPCRTEMPALNAVYARYRDEGLVVLGVDMTGIDTTGRKGRAFLDEMRAEYQVTGLPTTVFVARDGTLQSRWAGPIDEQTLSEKVEELLLQ